MVLIEQLSYIWSKICILTKHTSCQCSSCCLGTNGNLSSLHWCWLLVYDNIVLSFQVHWHSEFNDDSVLHHAWRYFVWYNHGYEPSQLVIHNHYNILLGLVWQQYHLKHHSCLSWAWLSWAKAIWQKQMDRSNNLWSWI